MRAPWRSVAFALIACVACGSRTDLPTGELPEPPPDDPADASIDARPDVADARPDAPPNPSCPATSSGGAPCTALSFKLGTQETCALTMLRPADALGMVPFTCPVNNPKCTKTLPDDCFGVLALLRVGQGHFAAYCDSTTVGEVFQRAKLLAYLGRVPSARIATLGNGYFGSAPGKNLGPTLPQKYFDPAVLAADFDIVIVSAAPYASSTVSATWAKTLFAFVSQFGKGLLTVADYVLPTVSPTVLDPMNAITRPMGVEFRPVDLGYAQLAVDLACVPDMP